MEKQTISFRLESTQYPRSILWRAMERDRTFLLSEAVEAYLETQRWHLEQIEAGIADADAGRLVDHRAVKAMASRWRGKKSK